MTQVSKKRQHLFTGSIYEDMAGYARAVIVGEPKLQITYQVCSETECLPAKVGTIAVDFKAEN